MDIPVMLDRLRVDVGRRIADGVFDLNMIMIARADAAAGAASYSGRRPNTSCSRGRNSA